MEIVSITEVLAAVADAVSVPEQEVARWKLSEIPDKSRLLGIESDTFGLFGKSGYEACLRLWCKRSMAARLLDFAFAEAPPEVLSWRDARQTGAFKKNPAARGLISPLLADLSKQYELCVQAHTAREISFSRPQEVPCRWTFFAPEWKQSIGFDKAEISEFLDRYIGPQLLDPTSPTETSSSDSMRLPADVDQTAATTGVLTHKISGYLPTNFEKLVERIFEQTLASISPADHTELRKYLIDTIWTRLCSLARKEEDRPDFVLGFKEKKGIAYIHGNNTKYFSKEALVKRIDRAMANGTGRMGERILAFRSQVAESAEVK
jgi:hypothetical protein